MMDFFNEVDEAVRHDQMMKFWKLWRLPLLAAAIGLIIGTAAFQAYRHYDISTREADASTLIRSMMAEEVKTDALKQLANDGTTPYRNMARFTLSRHALANTDAATATELLQQVADDRAHPLMKDMARLQQALLAVEKKNYPAAEALLTPLVETPGPLLSPARELYIINALDQNKRSEAKAMLERMLSDTTTDAATLQRAQQLLAPAVDAE